MHAFIPSTILTAPTQSSFLATSALFPHRPCPVVTLPLQRTCGRSNVLAIKAQVEAAEPPSDTGVQSSYAQSMSKNQLKLKILELAAVTSRGQNATTAQIEDMDEYVSALETQNPNISPVDSSLIDGEWSLIYSSGPFYASSPFLLASATPFLKVGQIRQFISVDSGELVNEADVEAFPLLNGTIVTTARIVPVGGDRLELTVAKTTLKGGNIAKRVDLGALTLDVPVEDIYKRIRGTSPETFLDTFYLDSDFRISRTKGGKMFIFSKAKAYY